MEHLFKEKGIIDDEQKLFQWLSKNAAVIILFSMAFLRLLTDGRERPPLPFPKICQTYRTIMKLGTLITYLKKIKKV